MFLFCVFYGNPKKETFFPHSVIMSSSATMVVISSLHVTKSHCCLTLLLKCPYAQSRPFCTFFATTRPPCFPGQKLHVLDLPSFLLQLLFLQPGVFPWLFSVLLYFASWTAKLTSCDGTGSETSPLDQALPFTPCPAFSPPKQYFVLWQAAASP